MTDDAPAMTEPGCLHSKCKLDHPHAGPAVLDDGRGSALGDQLDREIRARVTDAVRRADERLAHQLGEIGYEAYCESVGGVAFNGDPLPKFREIRDAKIRQGWADAATVIAKTIAGFIEPGPLRSDQP